MKLLRSIVPEMPALVFRTQQTEGAIRPDMWGYADTEPRVFVENKFWAGLTENQPVAYLKQLARYVQPTILLVVAPAAREQTLWRELMRLIGSAGISAVNTAGAFGRSATTSLGPILAQTSWSYVLDMLEREAANHPAVRSDLAQLRALCNAADNDAFTPATLAELTDQRTPAFILQLNSLIQATVDQAVTDGVLSITRLNPQANWWRIGRYARIPGREGSEVWLGTNFFFWKTHGGTPLWLLFPKDGDFGRAREVQRLLEPWAWRENIATAETANDFAVALDIPVGEEQEGVVRYLVNRLKAIAGVLSSLPPKSTAQPGGPQDAVSPKTPDLHEGAEVDIRENDAP